MSGSQKSIYSSPPPTLPSPFLHPSPYPTFTFLPQTPVPTPTSNADTSLSLDLHFPRFPFLCLSHVSLYVQLAAPQKLQLRLPMSAAALVALFDSFSHSLERGESHNRHETQLRTEVWNERKMGEVPIQ